jgi:RNA polymerase sigma-70 factor (ECF subfamily)
MPFGPRRVYETGNRETGFMVRARNRDAERTYHLPWLGPSGVTDDDRALVARCLAGDQDACATLVETYVRMVGTVIWRATGQLQDVDDLTQETFLRVFRALRYYDNRARLSTWIYTMAHRVTIDFLRRTAGTRKNLMLVAEPGAERLLETMVPSEALDPEALVVQGQHGELVREALAELPPKYRLPLVYAAIAGLDYATIADMLRLPVGTVKTHVFRGKQLLKLAIVRRMKVPHGR